MCSLYSLQLEYFLLDSEQLFSDYLQKLNVLHCTERWNNVLSVSDTRFSKMFSQHFQLSQEPVSIRRIVPHLPDFSSTLLVGLKLMVHIFIFVLQCSQEKATMATDAIQI